MKDVVICGLITIVYVASTYETRRKYRQSKMEIKKLRDELSSTKLQVSLLRDAIHEN